LSQGHAAVFGDTVKTVLDGALFILFSSSPPHPCSPLNQLALPPSVKAINTQKQGNFSSFSHYAVAHTTANELQKEESDGLTCRPLASGAVENRFLFREYAGGDFASSFVNPTGAADSDGYDLLGRPGLDSLCIPSTSTRNRMHVHGWI